MKQILTEKNTLMYKYTLKFDHNNTSVIHEFVDNNIEYFSRSMILDNIKWFCRFRWIVITILFLFGLMSLSPEFIQSLSLNPFQKWPFFVAVILMLSNILFQNHALSNERAKTLHDLKINIWSQIIFDILILTIAIHFIGSIETNIPFAYLFHIVLACIFFSRPKSLLITIMAGIFYTVCVVIETSGLVPSAGVYVNNLLRENIELTPWITFYHVTSTIMILFIVWYLGSHLSEMVRQKEYELIITNHRLKEAQEEKTRHLLRITHELKAPFAAVDANIQLLLKGHCGFFSDTALEVLNRISSRSRKLGHEIKEMLQLANLRTVNKDSLRWEKLDLADIIKWCKAQVLPTAEKREIIIKENLQPAPVVANEDHMKMLIVNLLSNAIAYSNEHGEVRVQSEPSAEAGPIITIEDHGLGIPGEKLSKIFDEYYRTDEAVRHNKNSTGLGLTIVRHVAKSHNITVNVASTPGMGTKFELIFPSSNNMRNLK